MNPVLRIVLFPVGEVDPGILAFLAEDLQDIFDAEVEISPSRVPLPGRHLAKERGQYLADGLLGEFSAIVRAPGDVLLGVTGADLFSPGLNFVFGIANRGKALISVHHLRPEFYDRHRPSGPGGSEPSAIAFRRRVLVEAVHELGHALGLDHCEFPACVMYFSNWIGDTDRKGPGFCFRCARRLERLLADGGL